MGNVEHEVLKRQTPRQAISDRNGEKGGPPLPQACVGHLR